VISKNNNFSNAQNVATVMHDIASPVTLIRLNLDLLENELEINQELKAQSVILKKYIKRAIIGVEKVSKVINYSLDTQYRNYRQEIFCVKKELINVIKNFEIRSIHEKVELKFNINHRCKIIGSKSAFHRVFGNLIGNALDAYSTCKNQDEKRIKITAHKGGEHFVITFEDRAGGIPESMQKYLFKEQYTTKSNGNGLGLISIKNLVVDHFKGFINCYSTKGKGTIFAIALPLAK